MNSNKKNKGKTMNTSRKNKSVWPLLMGLGLTGCFGVNWNELGDTWDTDVVATNDAVYAILPISEQLIKITTDGYYNVVDLNGAEPKSLVASPDGTRLLVFSDWESCSLDDKDIKVVSDCPDEELQVVSELAVIENGVSVNTYEVPSHLNTVSFSEDGNIAVAYLLASDVSNIQIDGFADLGEVAFINLQEAAAPDNPQSLSVGFSPTRILFSPNDQAIVMSRSQVVGVDLQSFSKVLEAPMTLDADDSVDPSGAELAYDPDTDALTLLLTVDNSQDLYMLDLQTEYWNIGDLGAVPSDIGVDDLTSQSVFVFSGSSKVTILDHSALSTLNNSSLYEISLEQAANKSKIGDGFALLYNDQNSYVHDVYHLDLNTRDLTEFVIANPLYDLLLSDSGSFAVGLMEPESSYSSGVDAYQDARYGVAVFDLVNQEITNLVAESMPIGVELIENENGAFALALLEGVDTLLQVDLNNPSRSTEIELPAPPVTIGSMPDGRFVISHQVSMGMISILDPNNPEQLTTISSFAAAGLMAEDELVQRNSEGE